jgi:hypothetical protein
MGKNFSLCAGDPTMKRVVWRATPSKEQVSRSANMNMVVYRTVRHWARDLDFTGYFTAPLSSANKHRDACLKGGLGGEDMPITIYVLEPARQSSQSNLTFAILLQHTVYTNLWIDTVTCRRGNVNVVSVAAASNAILAFRCWESGPWRLKADRFPDSSLLIGRAQHATCLLLQHHARSKLLLPFHQDTQPRCRTQ